MEDVIRASGDWGSVAACLALEELQYDVFVSFMLLALRDFCMSINIQQSWCPVAPIMQRAKTEPKNLSIQCARRDEDWSRYFACGRRNSGAIFFKPKLYLGVQSTFMLLLQKLRRPTSTASLLCVASRTRFQAANVASLGDCSNPSKCVIVRDTKMRAPTLVLSFRTMACHSTNSLYTPRVVPYRMRLQATNALNLLRSLWG